MDGTNGACDNTSNGDMIRIYDGGDINQPLINTFCGGVTPTAWVRRPSERGRSNTRRAPLGPFEHRQGQPQDDLRAK